MDNTIKNVGKLAALAAVMEGGLVSCVTQQQYAPMPQVSPQALLENAYAYSQTDPNMIVSVVTKIPGTGVVAFDTDGNKNTVEATATLDLTHPVEQRVYNALKVGDTMRVSDYRALYQEIRASYTH